MPQDSYIDFGGALTNMFNQMDKGAQYQQELARQQREERAKLPFIAAAAMQAANQGAFQGPQGLAQLKSFGGGWVPQVNTQGFLPSNPVPPAAPGGQPSYLQVMPEAWGKPTSQNNVDPNLLNPQVVPEPDRVPAAAPAPKVRQVAPQAPKQGQVADSIQELVLKQLNEISAEQANIQTAPKTQEEYFKQREENLKFLAQKYPQMVDQQTGQMHPYLVHQAEEQIKQQMAREQALDLKKQGLIQQMILLQGQRSTADINRQYKEKSAGSAAGGSVYSAQLRSMQNDIDEADKAMAAARKDLANPVVSGIAMAMALSTIKQAEADKKAAKEKRDQFLKTGRVPQSEGEATPLDVPQSTDQTTGAKRNGRYFSKSTNKYYIFENGKLVGVE